jgi:hypothetical protein
MIACRSFAASVEWTPRARRSVARLLAGRRSADLGSHEARARELDQAIETLQQSPLRCSVIGMRNGRRYRRLVVRQRFLVYYVYFAPRDMEVSGTVSIRAVVLGKEMRPRAGERTASPGECDRVEDAAELPG